MKLRVSTAGRYGDPEYGILLFKRQFHTARGFGGVNHTLWGKHRTLNIRFGKGQVFIWLEPHAVTQAIKEIEEEAATAKPCTACNGHPFTSKPGDTQFDPPQVCRTCRGSGRATEE